MPGDGPLEKWWGGGGWIFILHDFFCRPLLVHVFFFPDAWLFFSFLSYLHGFVFLVLLPWMNFFGFSHTPPPPLTFLMARSLHTWRLVYTAQSFWLRHLLITPKKPSETRNNCAELNCGVSGDATSFPGSSFRERTLGTRLPETFRARKTIIGSFGQKSISSLYSFKKACYKISLICWKSQLNFWETPEHEANRKCCEAGKTKMRFPGNQKQNSVIGWRHALCFHHAMRGKVWKAVVALNLGLAVHFLLIRGRKVIWPMYQ